ncbi:YhhN-like protein [Echria macrotheca]|uniref:YhhN-like protein n=1 Tax=Echria macrotheca TaxID=438768 RepID=A0AAJ0B7G2_9PEZI|nr:YhhN-like protein [Echria macrotheca]
MSSLETIILTLSLATSLSYTLTHRHPPGSPLRIATKTASTTLLAIHAHLHPSSPSLLSYALSLSSLGDFLLALPDSDTTFTLGLSSFLAAHILYIRLFSSSAHSGLQSALAHVFLSDDNTWKPATATVLGLFMIGMVVVLMPRLPRDLRIPVLVYSVAIYGMSVTALGLGDDKSKVVVGALMFTASDAILAMDRFLVDGTSSHKRWMGYAVWVLYYSGQVLITLGF